MRARHIRPHGAAVLAYTAVAVLFAWPLPLHLTDALLGSPAGDLGVYVWNLWVFRHELVTHHTLPFFTSEILSLTPPVPLVLQNYTTFANLLAFPLLPLAGVVATFNALTIASGVLTAYAMFLYARQRTGDAAAAWLAGLLFGFSPFMSARATEHFSLIQAAPLPIFGLVLFRISQAPTRRLSALAGIVVAWAFLCDPYYAVYCLFILCFTVGYSFVTVDFRPEPLRGAWWTTLVDLMLISVAGLIAGILLSGGGRVEVFGLRISFFRLYTPVLVFTVLALVRAWMAILPRFSWELPPSRRVATVLLPGLAVLALALSPVLYPMVSARASTSIGAGYIPWQNSAPGLDALAYLVPNPLHPWLSHLGAGWVATLPNGFTENVVSMPWVVLVTIGVAVGLIRYRPHAGWMAFAGVFALLSLGPFITVGGVATYVPTPWALIRYLPIIGAARMPPRIAVLALLGASMVFAMVVQHLRTKTARPGLLTAVIGVLLVAELLPAPRPLHSAAAPDILRIIAGDPRPLRVLNLPFGLRDGLSSTGNQSAEYQFQQTVHEKAIIGGYLSRLPRGEVGRYRQFPVMSALFDLSEGKALAPERAEAAIQGAHMRVQRFNIGWVVVDSRHATPELVSFARQAFDLELAASDGPWLLYRTSLTALH